MKRKSFFNRLLFNFMLTLVVPGITMLLLYFHADATVRKQIMVSSQNYLNQFFSAVDTIVEEMYDTCLTIIGNDDCKQYVSILSYKPERLNYQILLVGDALMELTQERYEDVFVYFPNGDRVISGKRGSTSSWHYYNSYYGNMESYNGENGGWEEFQSILNCSFRRPSFMTLKKDGRDYLCVAMQQHNYMNEKLNYVAVVILDRDYLDQLTGNTMMGTDMAFMMFNNNRELILADGLQMEKLPLFEYQEGQNTAVQKIGDQEYQILMQKSDFLNGYYATATSMNYFDRQLKYLRYTFGIGIVLSVICSVLIAWRNSVRSWNPFENLYNNLKEQDDCQHDSNVKNELEYIELLFRKEKDEKYSLKNMMKEGRLLQKERVLISLLYGFGYNDSGMDKCDISFMYPRFFVGSIEIEEMKDQDEQLLLFIIRNVFEELSIKLGTGYILPITKARCCLLLNCAESIKESQICQLIQQGKQFVEKYFQLVLNVGISERCETVLKIPDAFKQSQRALSYRYFGKAGDIILFSEVRDREFQYDYYKQNNMLKLIFEFMHDGKTNRDAKDFLRGVMSLYGIGKDISLETMECFRFEMINALYSMMTGSHYMQHQKEERLRSLLQAKDLSAFESSAEEILSELRSRQQEMICQKDICVQAKTIIEKYYGDTAMSLEFLGEKIGCSPTYLSRRFKERYGISVLEFIAETRIRIAKQLLEQTDRNVKDISEVCGYLSGGTFMRTFKKREGITPGQYRDMSREKEG